MQMFCQLFHKKNAADFSGDCITSSWNAAAEAHHHIGESKDSVRRSSELKHPGRMVGVPPFPKVRRQTITISNSVLTA